MIRGADEGHRYDRPRESWESCRCPNGSCPIARRRDPGGVTRGGVPCRDGPIGGELRARVVLLTYRHSGRDQARFHDGGPGGLRCWCRSRLVERAPCGQTRSDDRTRRPGSCRTTRALGRAGRPAGAVRLGQGPGRSKHQPRSRTRPRTRRTRRQAKKNKRATNEKKQQRKKGRPHTGTGVRAAGPRWRWGVGGIRVLVVGGAYREDRFRCPRQPLALAGRVAGPVLGDGSGPT